MNPGPVLIKPSSINEAWLMLNPHVKGKVGDWENRGWLCFCFLAAISFSYRRTLGSKVRVSLKLNPMFLFLKSKFGSRKKATGKDVDFSCCFLWAVLIFLHSSMQNWSLLLWLLYCLAMEVLDGQSQIMICFWLLSEFFVCFFFFLLQVSPGMQAAKL